MWFGIQSEWSLFVSSDNATQVISSDGTERINPLILLWGDSLFYLDTFCTAVVILCNSYTVRVVRGARITDSSYNVCLLLPLEALRGETNQYLSHLLQLKRAGWICPQAGEALTSAPYKFSIL